MQNITQEIMQTICELPEYKELKRSNGAADAKSDRFGFNYEPDSIISTEPLTFLESFIRLQTAAYELYGMVKRINRHSPLFSPMSGRLEKIVGQLGTCCLTKAVMEQQGETFPEIKLITMDELRSMTAFNMRKSYESFMESSAFGNYSRFTFDLMLRWSAMDRRLLATAEKIEKIKAGNLKVDIKENKPTSASRKETEEAAEKPTAPLSEKASALPVDKAALREAGMQKAADTSADEAEPVIEDSPEPGQPREDGEPAGTSAEAEVPEFNDEVAEHEKYMRHTLMQDAVDRADREAYEAVCRAEGLDLYFLWSDYMQRENEKDRLELEALLGIPIPKEPPPEIFEPEPIEIYASAKT